jgi:DNA-binding FrmR family transcriptional regulator
MKIQNSEAKEKLTQRLNRIEGQVRGLKTMFADERDCREIMQQLAAIHAAIQSTSRAFFQEYATRCLLAMDNTLQENQLMDIPSKRETLIEEMFTLFDKVP